MLKYVTRIKYITSTNKFINEKSELVYGHAMEDLVETYGMTSDQAYDFLHKLFWAAIREET